MLFQKKNEEMNLSLLKGCDIKKHYGARQCAKVRVYHIVGGIPTEKGLANH